MPARSLLSDARRQILDAVGTTAALGREACLKAEVRETGPLQRELDIHLDTAEVGRFIDGMIATYQRRYTLPGFRPGKAPERVVQARFHDDIERAVLNELVPESIERAYAEHHLRPAGGAEVLQMRYQPGEPLTFTVRTDVWPEVALKPYEGMILERVVTPVEPEAVEQFLVTMQDRAADQTPVARPSAPGDVLEAQLETIDGTGKRLKGTKVEKVVMDVGGERLLPEFRAASLGVGPDEVREFSVQYPAEYGQADLRGQRRQYRLRVVQIREKKIPPLDDEFAKRFDPNLDLDGLRARIRLRLESERRFQAREKLEESLIERLIRENPFDLPESPVQGALDRLVAKVREEHPDADPDAVRAAYRPHVEHLQRRDLLLALAAEREGIRVGPEDVDAEISRMAREEKRTVEQVRTDLGDLDRFGRFLFERKVLEALIGKADVRDVGETGGPRIIVPGQAGGGIGHGGA